MKPLVCNSAVAVACLALLPSGSRAQVFADWVATGAAAYHNDLSWSINGQPPGVVGSTPDTPGEAARFAQPGGFTVELTPGATTTVGAIEVSNGASVSLGLDPLSQTNGSSVLSATGDLVIDNAQFELSGSGGVQGDSIGITASRLLLRNGGTLTSHQATSLVLDQTIISTGQTGLATSFAISSAGLRRLGNTSVGETGASASSDAELLITSNAVVETGDLSIAATGADNRGSVSVFLASLNQSTGATLTLGLDAGTDTGSLLIGPGGAVRTGSGGATVHRSGTLRNSGGHLEINGDLVINQGRYVETAGATRGLASGVGIRVEAGGVLELADQPLNLSGVQSLTVSGGEVTGSGDLSLGPNTTLAIELDALGGAEAPIRFDGDATLGGVLTLGLAEGVTPNLGDSAPLVSAAGFVEVPSLFSAPPLPAGLGWELQTDSSDLRLVVVGTGAPGDFNRDGQVNAADYAAIRDQAEPSSIVAEIEIWRQHFGDPASAIAASTAVPEPSTLASAAVGVLLGWRPQSRRRCLCAEPRQV